MMALLKVVYWSTPKSEKDFAVVISSMIDSPKWTLRPWRVTIEAQLNSWGMYVPGVSSSSEMVEMKKFKGDDFLRTTKSCTTASRN